MRRRSHARKVTVGEPPVVYTPTKLAADVAKGTQTTAQYEAFNALIGPRKLDRSMFFTSWSLPIIQTYSETIANNTGTEIIVAWQPTTWADVLTGAKDAYLKEQCAVAKAWAPKTLIVRLAHEFNGNWKVGFGSFTESAAEFKAKWQYVVNFFKAEGVTNIKWAWNPNTWGGASTMDPTTYYPGAEYVHVFGVDAYMKEGQVAKTPTEMIGTYYESMHAIDPTKDFYIFETGCCPSGKDKEAKLDKAAWFTNLSKLGTLIPIAGLGYWNRDEGAGEGDFTIDSSGTDIPAREAFKAMVNNPRFV